MSISSSGSVFVGFRGDAVPLDEALDETIRNLQKHLNMVQVKLREIAVLVEQDPDFQEEVKLSDDLDDELRDMNWLFSDLRSMAYDLISIPDLPEDKAWFKQHKIDRKANEKKVQAEHAAKIKEERVQQKKAMKEIDNMSQMSCMDTIEE
jgi:hypothetical protein